MIVVKNDCTFVIENKTAILTGVPKTLGSEFIIPPFVNGNPVEIIDERVFQNNSKIVNVGIPASVTDIKEGAFANCTNLKNIKFYQTPKVSRVCKLHKSTFANCYSLQSILFVERVLINGESVFLNCKNLSDIKGKFNSLLAGTFSGCENLKELTFYGKSFISTSALYKCTKLSQVTMWGELSPKTPTKVIEYLKELKIICPENSTFMAWAYEGVHVEVMENNDDDFFEWL